MEKSSSLQARAVSGGNVYVGSGDHKVYCLNAITGTQVWNYTTGYVVYSSPAVSGGIVYLGYNNPSADYIGSKVWAFGTVTAVPEFPTVISMIILLTGLTGTMLLSKRMRYAKRVL